MNKKMIAIAVMSIFISSLAYAAPKHVGKMETCMKAALAKHPGEVLTLEAEISKGNAQYEFDIKDKDGNEWEVECSAKTGKIIEVEQEFPTADDPTFKAKVKITQEEAMKTALAKHPGEVVDSEFSIEANGNPSYEFDIKMANGKEIEVEIDAITGKLEENPEEEIYQIGIEQ